MRADKGWGAGKTVNHYWKKPESAFSQQIKPNHGYPYN